MIAFARRSISTTTARVCCRTTLWDSKRAVEETFFSGRSATGGAYGGQHVRGDLSSVSDHDGGEPGRY